MSVAYEASKHLHRTRSEIIESGRPSIPSPGLTKGKQNTKIGGPRRATQHGPTPLSHEVDMSDTGLISEEEFEEIQRFYRDICNQEGDEANTVESNDNTYIGWSTEKIDDNIVKVTDSFMAEPDDYDIEMAKAEADGLFNASCDEQAEPSLEAPGLPDFDSVGKEETEGQRKRKQESDLAPEVSPAALSGHVDHGEKRRKLETGTNSSGLSAPRRRKKSAKEQGGKLQPHYLFSRSSSLAAVFQAALAVGALGAPQEDNSDDSELDSLDLELLGEEPSNSEQTQASVSEDPKVAVAEALYQLISLDDLHVATAGANLLSSDISELEPADRVALKDAFGDSKEVQPSTQVEDPMPFTTLPRTVRFSDHYIINKSLMRKNGTKFKRYGTPTRASQAFQLLFEEQRLRKLVLDQGTAPTAGFGSEFVAKSLLDVSSTVCLTPNRILLIFYPGPSLTASKTCTRFTNVPPQAPEAGFTAQCQGSLPERGEKNCPDKEVGPQCEEGGAKSWGEDTRVES